MASVLSRQLSQTRTKLDGLHTTNDKIFDKILQLFEERGNLSALEVSKEIGKSREHTQRAFFKPLIDSGKIKTVPATKGIYQLPKSNISKTDLENIILSESEIMQTELLKGWIKRTSSKHRMKFIARFVKICLGEINPRFKIHPDSITEHNYPQVIENMKNAILESTGKNELSRNDREVLRFIIIFGLNRQLSQTESKQLGIVGDKDKSTLATLDIKEEQLTQLKALAKKLDKKEFCKIGIKLWTGVRPSIIYTLETDDLQFYNRTVKYVESENGDRIFSRDVIKYVESSDPSKIKSYTHRACKIPKVHEFKQDEDYQKYVFDEEFVIELEKYCKHRRAFSKKRYLFWDDNNTEFDFLTYDKIVVSQITKDNNLLKKLLVQIGFKSKDFGKCFRANYGMRHFAIQQWLQFTNYNYDIVAKMFHKSVETTKQWYGEMVAEFFENEISEVAL